jgi:hypothetical protein
MKRAFELLQHSTHSKRRIHIPINVFLLSDVFPAVEFLPIFKFPPIIGFFPAIEVLVVENIFCHLSEFPVDIHDHCY